MSKETDPTNIVPPESAVHHPDGALDDPIYDYWEKNKKSFYSTAVLVVVLATVFLGYRSYREAQFQRLQENFLAAWAEDRLADFAETSAGLPLAGVAAMQAARLAASEGNLPEALGLYESAVLSLERTPLAGKARLALAATLFDLGRAEEAERHWSALSGEVGLNAAVRSEAAYLLAIAALAAGQPELFARRVEQLMAVDQSGLWRERIAFYQSIQPVPVLEPAGEAPEAAVEAEAVEDSGGSAPEEVSGEGPSAD